MGDRPFNNSIFLFFNLALAQIVVRKVSLATLERFNHLFVTMVNSKLRDVNTSFTWRKNTCRAIVCCWERCRGKK